LCFVQPQFEHDFTNQVVCSVLCLRFLCQHETFIPTFSSSPRQSFHYIPPTTRCMGRSSCVTFLPSQLIVERYDPLVPINSRTDVAFELELPDVV
jgi:hypothetical protein